MKSRLPNLTKSTYFNRNAAVVNAVLINEYVEKGRLKINSITPRGEIWAHSPDDILLSIPGFVPRHVVEQIELSDDAETRQDSLARLQIIKKLESFERKISITESIYAPTVSEWYEKAYSQDANQWSRVRIDDILASHSSQNLAGNEATARVAIHKLLMAEPLNFVASGLHRATLEFSTRPRAEVENIQRVVEWIRNDSPKINSFVEKARKIAELSSQLSETRRESVISAAEVAAPRFQQSDKDIISFLRCSIRKRSQHQRSPYEGFAPMIIKRIGLHKVDITDNVIFDFLRDIGALEPWHSPVFLSEEQVVTEGQIISNHSPTTKLSTVDPHESLRHDWGQLPVFVIDSADAEELDDGISIEHANDGSNWMHIHIADPTTRLPISHPIAAAANARASTIYGSQSVFPMLPSEYAMSEYSLGGKVLKEKGYQQVLTFSAHIDATGTLLSSTIRPGIIRNVQVVTYNAVEEAWKTDRPYLLWPFGESLNEPASPEISSEFLYILSDIRNVGERLKHQRDSLARFSWTTTKAKVFFPDKPLPTLQSAPQLWRGFPKMVYGVETGELSPARAMVAEMMILAGQIAGRFCTERELPGLFRTAEKPIGLSDDMMADIKTEGAHIPLDVVFKASVASKPAYYSPVTDGHWALGIDKQDGGYVRVTSPLRRFADMVMHWQIKNALLGNSKPLIDVKEMDQYAKKLHERERLINLLTRADNGYWAAVYIQRKLESSTDPGPLNGLEGYVSSVTPDYETFSRTSVVPVFMPEIGIKGWLPYTEGAFTLGQKIKVKVTGVTMVGKAKVRLELAY
jgi:hypothetical protein